MLRRKARQREAAGMRLLLSPQRARSSLHKKWRKPSRTSLLYAWWGIRTPPPSPHEELMWNLWWGREDAYIRFCEGSEHLR